MADRANKSEKKPILCRLGFHRKYLDAALFSRVERCSDCVWVADPYAAKRLEKERNLWAEAPPNESIEDGIVRVGTAIVGCRLKPQLYDQDA